MENFLRCCEYFGTMNRCYARGLTAVPPPLPEGEGRGEGEFWRLRPYGSSKGGPYIRTILSAFTALFLASTAPATAATNGPDLAPLGPFPVGITTALLVDSNRTDAFTREPRSLVTEIWYPATDDARQLPKNKYSDFFAGGLSPELALLVQQRYKLPVAELDKIFWNHAVRDARVRDGKFPLVIFSHGNGGNRHQNTFWSDYLASYGYIIISPDYIGNADLTVIKGKPIIYQGSQRSASAIDRPN